MRHFITGMIFLAVLSLVGCASGGGSSGGINSAPPQKIVIDSSHLTEINEPQAKVVGAEGSGVTVAVLDSGIRRTHDEFSSTTVMAGYNVADANTDTSDVDTAEQGHGTHVASLIVGSNVGVAPQATLMPVRMVAADQSLTNDDIVAAMAYATTNGAKIQNISATMINVPKLATALNNSAAAGMLTVIAAGNTGDSNPSPVYLLDPTQSSVTTQAVNQSLVVGAVDANKNIASFSDRAGTLKDRYLVAPGVSVNGATNQGNSDYSAVSGTSFSTPLVSGAAAVVWAGDPSLSAAQVASILLSTADDLGAPGVDPVYGHGMLDVAAALKPIGLLGIPTSTTASGVKLVANSTYMQMGRAFGDALINTPALAKVVGLDDYNRPYTIDMRGSVASSAGENYAESRVMTAGSQDQTLTDALPGGDLYVSFSGQSAPVNKMGVRADRGVNQSSLLMSYTGRSHGVAYEYVVGGQAADLVGTSRIVNDDWLNPMPADAAHLGLIADDNRAVLAAIGGGRWSMRAGFMMGRTATYNRTPATAGVLAWRYAGAASTWTVTLTDLAETKSFLGSESSSALAVGSTSNTSAVGMGFVVPLAHRIRVVGGYSVGITHMESKRGSLLRDWSPIRSSAYSLGASCETKAGEVGARLVRPLRVDSASVELNVPVARLLDHSIVRTSTRANLSPSGEEKDIDTYYRFSSEHAGSVAAHLMYMSQPGNVRSAAPVVVAVIEDHVQW